MKRDDSVTISKAIGIILMVIGHSGLGGHLTSFIYLFHMPLFFFLSGYCFKENYIYSPKVFFKKRIEGVYFPYIKWAILFLLFHNIFEKCYFYSDTYSVGQYLKHLTTIVLAMKGEEQLLGGFWFLNTLFWGAVIFFVIKKIFSFHYGLKIGGALLLCFCIVFNAFSLRIPFWGINDKIFLAAFFMLIGNVLSHKKIALTPIVITIGVGFMLLGTFFWHQQMLSLKCKTIIPYTITAVIGSYLTLYLVKRIKWINFRYLYTIFLYIGNNTLVIFIWHFLSFKIVSLLVILLYNFPISRMSEFPVLNDIPNKGWWFAYSMIGVCFPLVINKSINLAKVLFLKVIR